MLEQEVEYAEKIISLLELNCAVGICIILVIISIAIIRFWRLLINIFL